MKMLDPGLDLAAMVTPYASDAVGTGDQLAGQLLECGMQLCDRTALNLVDAARDRRLGVAAGSCDAAHLVQSVFVVSEVAGEDVQNLVEASGADGVDQAATGQQALARVKAGGDMVEVERVRTGLR